MSTVQIVLVACFGQQGQNQRDDSNIGIAVSLLKSNALNVEAFTVLLLVAILCSISTHPPPQVCLLFNNAHTSLNIAATFVDQKEGNNRKCNA